MTYPGREPHYVPKSFAWSGVSKEDLMDCFWVAMQRIHGDDVTAETAMAFVNNERKLKGQKPRYLWKDEAKASGVETLRAPPNPKGSGIRAGDLL